MCGAKAVVWSKGCARRAWREGRRIGFMGAVLRPGLRRAIMVLGLQGGHQRPWAKGLKCQAVALKARGCGAKGGKVQV